eukprot:scaffold189252_cov24-Tisochrysis_lutea.AAC.1
MAESKEANTFDVHIGDVNSKRSELSLHSKVSHILAIVVSGVIALCVAAVLADGSSVVKLKHPSDLPRLTDASLIQHGLDYRADELLGPSYGVGLHHDSSGYTWTQAGAGATLQKYIDELGLHQVIAAVPSVIATDGLKHPVHFLSCHNLKATGQAAMAFGFIAEVVAAVMIIFHSLALLGVAQGALGGKIVKLFACLIWLVLSVGFLIVCCLAIGVIETTWTCDNPFVPSIKLSQHFYYNWAFYIAYVGYAAALFIFVVQLVFTSTMDGQEAPAKSVPKGPVKALGGLFVGVVIGVVASVIVGAANNSFAAEPSPDPNVNPCSGQKPTHAGPGDNYFLNVPCMMDGIVAVLEQAGANVTRGYVGGLDAGEWRVPITESYDQTDLCPVNVHWHLGAEHLSVGEYDEHGTGPMADDGVHLPDGYCHEDESSGHRQLAGECTRLGFRCHHFNATDPKFTKPYDWKHCTDMVVGETYEVHWPHSAAGACGTEWQYQTPFYDGVFCHDGIINILTPLNTYQKIGVQSQTFTIVNDEGYDLPDGQNLFDGMIMYQDIDIAKYTGSTTGTSRDNDMCSRYAPITWQVDRTCRLISASSFDKMCEKMKQQKDDMKDDLYPHGARELVADHLVANNQQSRA